MTSQNNSLPQKNYADPYGQYLPGLKADKTWYLGYRHNNLDKVKHCPVCGSANLKMPNDLYEWICLDCGAWWSIS